MHHLLQTILLAGVAAATNHTKRHTTCFVNPSLQITAGSIISAVMDSNNTCTATLMFSGTEFPHILYAFDNDRCPQVSLLEFVLPPQVPNGDAVILWQCAGQSAQTCYQASISEGLNNPNDVQYAQNGTVTCLNLASTTTATTTTTTKSGVETGIGITRDKGTQFTPTSSWVSSTTHQSWNATSQLSSTNRRWPNTTSLTSPSSKPPVSLNTTPAISTPSQTVSVSAPPMTARAAKNLPQSCFAMAAVLASLTNS